MSKVGLRELLRLEPCTGDSSKRRSFFCKLEHYTVVGILLEQGREKIDIFECQKNSIVEFQRLISS